MAEVALPLHPSKRHPLTGRPLQALAARPKRWGKSPLASDWTLGYVWPGMGGSEETPPTPETPPNPAPEAATFPADTPVAEMTASEQAAYWKDKARKHEGRAKAFDGLTPDELASLREKAKRQDELEHELASETEKAVREAKTTAQAETEAQYKPLLAETAFRVAIGDRKTEEEVSEFIADLNLTRFLTDQGRVDTAKVLARVEQFAPAMGTQQQRPKGPTVTAHGSGSRAGSRQSSSAGSVAAVMAERRAARDQQQSQTTS